MYDVIIPAQGEFGEWHPGWGQETRLPFFTVYRFISEYLQIPLYSDSKTFQKTNGQKKVTKGITALFRS